MRIVLTNDDGYDAPGLLALRDAVRSLGEVEVGIIAPAQAQSGKGHAVSAELRCRRVTVEGLGGVLVVEGTPADCVRVALHLPGQPRPDWVVAGINRGSNLGIDVFYSGTVAAVREAAILSTPAIAISQLVKTGLEDDWARSRNEAAAVVAALIRPDEVAPAGSDHELHRQAVRAIREYRQTTGARSVTPDCWNVNLPRPPADQGPTGVRVVPVSTDPLPLAYAHSLADDGTECLRYCGSYHTRAVTAGTDVAAVFAGAVTLSPLHL